MKPFLDKEILFIAEQDGEVEREFKNSIVSMLLRLKKVTRVYLTQVRYDAVVKAFNVAICYKLDRNDFDEAILKETTNIFKRKFGSHEHVDIIFLNSSQELKLREVCCPFFTSPLFQAQQPDFYLASTEDSALNLPIECFKRKKIAGVNPGGYLLCDVKPAIIGQRYGLGEKNIDQLIFVCRHSNSTLFPISEWPISVYVTRSLIQGIEQVNYVKESDVELMYWGCLYRNKNDVPD